MDGAGQMARRVKQIGTILTERPKSGSQAPTLGQSDQPVTPTPDDLIPSFEVSRHLHSCAHVNTQTYTYTHNQK